MNPYTEGYFEKGEGSNYKGYEDSSMFEAWADELIRLFDCKNKKLRVLDIGCAKGFLVKHLRDNGVEAWGIDISPYAIESSPVKEYLVCGEVTDLPFEDNYFDVVTSHDVFEHISKEDTPKAIKECLRVGRKQYHVITCKEYDFGGDKTHINMENEAYWKDTWPEIIIRRSSEKNTLYD